MWKIRGGRVGLGRKIMILILVLLGLYSSWRYSSEGSYLGKYVVKKMGGWLGKDYNKIEIEKEEELRSG